MPFNPGPEFTSAMAHVSEERLQELIRENEARLIRELPDNGLGAEAANAYALRNAPTTPEGDDGLRSLPVFHKVRLTKRLILSAADPRRSSEAVAVEADGVVSGSQARSGLGGRTGADPAGHARLGSQGGIDHADGRRLAEARPSWGLARTQYMNVGTQDLALR